MTLLQWYASQSGLLFTILSFAVLLSPYLGTISDRHGPRPLTIAGLSLITLIFAALGTVMISGSPTSTTLLCGLLLLLGISIVCIQNPNIREISVVVKKQEKLRPGRFGDGAGMAQGYALLNMAYGIGTLLGPLSSGFLVGSFDWRTMCLSFAGLNGLSAVLMVFFSGEGFGHVGS